MSITYRRAALEDIDILVAYRLRFLAEHSGTPEVSKDETFKENLREYFLQSMPKGAFIAWLAKRGEEVVATSGMVIWQIPPNNSVKTGKQGYILNMYTVPEARRQGICTVLLEKMIQEARSSGLSRVHLHASKMGEPIYRKRGFKEPGNVELILRIEK
jgi:GNAT superfamily N-acetyltransferase